MIAAFQTIIGKAVLKTLESPKLWPVYKPPPQKKTKDIDV